MKTRDSVHVSWLARRMSPSFVGLISLFGMLAASSLVRAEPTPEGASGNEAAERDADKITEDLMREGIKEYRRGNLELARATLEKAWVRKRHTEVAAILAEIEMKLGRYDEAADHWVYYLIHRPPDREEAEAQLAECRQHLGALRVDVDRPGAVVYVDDEAIGAAPLSSEIWISPGIHRLRADLDGHASRQVAITVVVGKIETVTLTVDGAEPNPAASTSPRSVAHKTSPLRAPLQERHTGIETRTGVLIGEGVLTIATAGVGLAYLLRANAAEDRARGLRAEAMSQSTPELVETQSYCIPRQRPAACDELKEKVLEVRTAHDVAGVAFIGAGVFALATLGTYVLWRPASEERLQASIRLAPLAVQGSRGIEIGIGF